VKLTPTIEKYILHWGEMGSRWGVNRTIAQIHALLYLSPKALPADEITELLSVARSNVSTGLKELQTYGLIKVSHVLGDRRDHFEALTDPWDLFMVILDQRKQREVDPTLALLRQCVEDAKNDHETDQSTKQRINDMLTMMEETSGWYHQLRTIPKEKLRKLMKLGAKVVKFVT